MVLSILSGITPAAAAMILGITISLLAFIYKMKGGDLCNTHSTDIALLNQSQTSTNSRLKNLEETTRKTNETVNKIYRNMPKRENDGA